MLTRTGEIVLSVIGAVINLIGVIAFGSLSTFTDKSSRIHWRLHGQRRHHIGKWHTGKNC